MTHLQNLIAARKRPFLKIRRVQGPTWITATRGRYRYSLRSYTIKTTTVQVAS